MRPYAKTRIPSRRISAAAGDGVQAVGHPQAAYQLQFQRRESVVAAFGAQESAVEKAPDAFHAISGSCRISSSAPRFCNSWDHSSGHPGERPFCGATLRVGDVPNCELTVGFGHARLISETSVDVAE
jgi:hypothetical protein